MKKFHKDPFYNLFRKGESISNTYDAHTIPDTLGFLVLLLDEKNKFFLFFLNDVGASSFSWEVKQQS